MLSKSFTKIKAPRPEINFDALEEQVERLEGSWFVLSEAASLYLDTLKEKEKRNSVMLDDWSELLEQRIQQSNRVVNEAKVYTVLKEEGTIEYFNSYQLHVLSEITRENRETLDIHGVQILQADNEVALELAKVDGLMYGESYLYKCGTVQEKRFISYQILLDLGTVCIPEVVEVMLSSGRIKKVSIHYNSSLSDVEQTLAISSNNKKFKLFNIDNYRGRYILIDALINESELIEEYVQSPREYSDSERLVDTLSFEEHDNWQVKRYWKYSTLIKGLRVLGKEHSNKSKDSRSFEGQFSSIALVEKIINEKKATYRCALQLLQEDTVKKSYEFLWPMTEIQEKVEAFLFDSVYSYYKISLPIDKSSPFEIENEKGDLVTGSFYDSASGSYISDLSLVHSTENLIVRVEGKLPYLTFIYVTNKDYSLELPIEKSGEVILVGPGKISLANNSGYDKYVVTIEAEKNEALIDEISLVINKE